MEMEREVRQHMERLAQALPMQGRGATRKRVFPAAFPKVFPGEPWADFSPDSFPTIFPKEFPKDIPGGFRLVFRALSGVR